MIRARYREPFTGSLCTAEVVTVGSQVATTLGLVLLAHRHPNAPLIVRLATGTYTAVIPEDVSIVARPADTGGVDAAAGSGECDGNVRGAGECGAVDY